MPTLKDHHKLFIIQQLAAFKQPQEVADLVKQEFGFTITRQQVYHYQPHNQKMSEKLIEIFNDARKRYLEKVNEIPIANEAYRMEILQQSLNRLLKPKVVNEPLVLNVLEQAAKERGGMFTNRREITGKNGKDLVNPVLIARAVMQELVEKGWNEADAVNFVKDRYKLNEAELVSDASN